MLNELLSEGARVADPESFRVVQLIQREPPDEVLRHATLTPGPSGRYGRTMRYRYAKTQTIYEVLQFKAGRPPAREEVLTDLRADLAALDAQLAEARKAGVLDRALFGGATPSDLERKRREILETIETVEETYRPGEAVPVP